MAALDTSSRSGSSRESLEVTRQSESLASNSQFMQFLRQLPDEVERLERKINRLEKEAQASPSRSGSSKESLEVTRQSESLASNSQFMQFLRQLPDDLEQLERKINRFEKEAQASPSRERNTTEAVFKTLVDEAVYLLDSHDAGEDAIPALRKVHQALETSLADYKYSTAPYTLRSCLGEEPVAVVKGVDDDITEMWKQMDEKYGDPA